MNERIKQLALQAGLNFDGYGVYVPTSLALQETVNLQKFAELIVKECADAGDMAYDARCPYIGDYIGEQMGYGEEHGIANWRMS